MNETAEAANAGTSPAEAQAGHAAPADPHAACANCDSPLGGPFCAQCGQSAHIHRSLAHLAEEVLHGVLHFDAKGWKTIPLLIVDPGRLTRSYIDGRRTKYVSPLALFLFLLFVSFFVASMAGLAPGDPLPAPYALGQGQSVVDGPEAGIAASASAVQANRALMSAAAERSAAVRIADQLKRNGWVHSDIPHLDAATRLALDNPDLAAYKLKSTAYKFSFLLVPISLPFLWLMFVGKPGITMFDHAVFVLYSLCFMSLLFVILVVLEIAGWKAVLPWLGALVVPLHIWAQLRGTYGIGPVAALWRTVVLLLVAAFVVFVFMLAVLVMSMT